MGAAMLLTAINVIDRRGSSVCLRMQTAEVRELDLHAKDRVQLGAAWSWQLHALFDKQNKDNYLAFTPITISHWYGSRV